MEHKSVPFELRAASGDGGEFEGYAACFCNIDAYGDIIAPGAFADSLPEFLKAGFIGGINHDWYEPIGKPQAATEDARGLLVKGRISDTQHGRDCKTLLRDGVVTKLSIGFRTVGRVWLDTSDDVMKWWAGVGYQPGPSDIAASQYGARLLTKLHLYEFSPVTVPANNGADITRVKADGTPVGLRFDDHSLSVLAAVEEFTERARSLAELRGTEGRTLAPEHVARFARLQASLADLVDSANVKAAKPATAAVLALQADTLRMEAELAGLIHGGNR